MLLRWEESDIPLHNTVGDQITPRHSLHTTKKYFDTYFGKKKQKKNKKEDTFILHCFSKFWLQKTPSMEIAMDQLFKKKIFKNLEK